MIAVQAIIEGVKPPPAPKETVEAVRDAVLDYIKRNGFSWDQGEPEETASDIADVWMRHKDGYELGRDLERVHGWDVDMQIAEDLDGVGSAVSAWMRTLRKEWAAAWNVQPPYPIGTRITRGVITGISEHVAATYEVQEDKPKHPTLKLLIKFEDAKAIDQSGGTQ